MRKFLLFLILVFFIVDGIVYSVGEFGAGTFGDGDFGFGTPEPPTTTPSVSSAGGGGGGGGIYVPSKSDEPITYRLNLIKGQTYTLTVNGIIHKFKIALIDVDDKSAGLEFESAKKVFYLKLNESDYLDYDDDNYADLEITLTKIYGYELVEITMKTVHVEIVSGGAGVPEPIIESIGGLNIIEEPQQIEIQPEHPQEVPQKPKYKFGLGQLLLVIIIILIIVGIFYWRKQSKNGKNNKKKNQ